MLSNGNGSTREHLQEAVHQQKANQALAVSSRLSLAAVFPITCLVLLSASVSSPVQWVQSLPVGALCFAVGVTGHQAGPERWSCTVWVYDTNGTEMIACKSPSHNSPL